MRDVSTSNPFGGIILKETIVFFLSKTQKSNLGLILFALIGCIIIVFRCRLGVDLTDDVWYSSDPYWVAKGSIPYVNNWTQAPGFTLPLFVFHSFYMTVTGSNEGIILFSRILFCVWRTLVIILSFYCFRKSGIYIPPLLAIPIIALQEYQLYAINYNSIGLSYTLLIFSILSISINSDGKLSPNKEKIIGVIVGLLMGRCVIGTPSTVVVLVFIIFMLLYHNKLIMLKCFIIGGILAALSVITFCCYRGGVAHFIIGIQYLFKDLGYIQASGKLIVSSWNITRSLFWYLVPSFLIIGIIVVLKCLLKNRIKIYNYSIIIISSLMLVCAIYYLKYYTGSSSSLVMATKYGWVIPSICVFFQCDNSVKKKLRFIQYLSLAYMCVFIVQIYISVNGFSSRMYLNYTSLILGIYSIYICFLKTYKKNSIYHEAGLLICCLAITIFVVRGSYMYVYRDLPCKQLTEKVERGVWRGCQTTQKRASTVVEIERYMRSRTNDNDQVLCWGKWACFLNLLHNGHLCSASPLGSGPKNGFDFWHMYQVVPTKIFVHVDTDDRYGLMSETDNTYNVWGFITRFYTKEDEFNYTSYDEQGKPVYYRIVEYDVFNPDDALLYADFMATKVFDFK